MRFSRRRKGREAGRGHGVEIPRVCGESYRLATNLCRRERLMPLQERKPFS